MISHWGLAFFGLTQQNKDDLFLNEVNFLCENRNWSYWDVYKLPVPIRKWFIKKTIEKIEKANKANGSSDSTRPLTESERIQMINKAQQANNDPSISKMFQYVPKK